jgi:hypothetical protein
MMRLLIRHIVGCRPSEAHSGGWEGLWRGGIGTEIDLLNHSFLLRAKEMIERTRPWSFG